MLRHEWSSRGLPAVLLVLLASPAGAQSFRVQCPTSTITHPSALRDNNSEPAYVGPTTLAPDPTGQYLAPSANVNGAIKCQQISGGDGFATMGDGTQTYLFSFGPLSGLTDIASGQPGTEFPSVFNTPYSGTTPLQPGDPATNGLASYNGAVGLAPDQAVVLDPTTDQHCAVNSTDPACITGHVDPRQIMDVGVMNGNIPAPLMALDEDDEFFLTLTNVGPVWGPARGRS